MSSVTLIHLKDELKSFKLEEYSDIKCPECGSTMIAAEGCATCPVCGYSKCS
ncbi:MAG: hypothetical protein QXX74_00320 [Candidatus Micrarchaeaceae archaeon]